jgi:periplasmic nitrate reductase NapE
VETGAGLIQIKARTDSNPDTDPWAAALMPPIIAAYRVRRNMSAAGNDTGGRPRRRRMEIFAFLFLTAVLMPALAVATVASYGLTVWIYQVLAGPPGPPAR